jgi:hypothetical protein
MSRDLRLNLEEQTHRLVAEEMLRQHRLRKVLRQFQQKKIPVILLKGTAFSGTLYPPGTPRGASDLDLLVRAADFDAACEALSTGMVVLSRDPQRPAYHDRLYERTFRSEGGTGLQVDVHRQLINPFLFEISEEQLWEESREHPAYGSADVRMLSPEATLLHLAVHAFKDLEFCNHNLLDVHEIFCRWNPVPSRLAGMASVWRAKRALYVLLENCRTVMETEVPSSLLDSLRPGPALRAVVGGLLKGRTQKDFSDKSPGFRLRQLVSQIALTDRVSAGLRFQLHYVGLRLRDLTGF